MAAPLAFNASNITVLLFGPHFLSYSEESLGQLRSALLKAPENRWILQVIAELPGNYETLSNTIPGLYNTLGSKLLENMNDWVVTGKLSEMPFPLANIILTPLVVITELMQYSKFLQLALPEPDERHNVCTFFKPNAEAMGFCTGLLSALVVSSSTSQAQFQQNASNAVRLAMLIGAFVDSHDTSSDLQSESKSFSVAWSSPRSAADIQRILSRFPEVRSFL